jgi:hypothetical protein
VANRDVSLDVLLLLDGESFVVHSDDGCWTSFMVKRVPATSERPHGLRYSLTLHDGYGERLVGFDNAHAIQEGAGPGAKTRIEYDHKHVGERIRFYEYADAATLLADFWNEVDNILRMRSSI